jgi:hypothetical protein
MATLPQLARLHIKQRAEKIFIWINGMALPGEMS